MDLSQPALQRRHPLTLLQTEVDLSTDQRRLPEGRLISRMGHTMYKAGEAASSDSLLSLTHFCVVHFFFPLFLPTTPTQHTLTHPLPTLLILQTHPDNLVWFLNELLLLIFLYFTYR